ncbi:hypothetical protein [Asanoa iriomotensis]|uniref:Uncharacterized protein n=1 Tax=Asanoa iriomotensis TaxID=234613 RepID=A0ABQ4CEC9_9ACTN|nr:hypothetical protein [Asanoa iriomotensis]GIF61110.1 hypothetical protein Air01nite_72050 [Asanoa iriomotensis]
MSKTVSVEYGGRWFWAYDVSLGVLLLEAIHVAAEPGPSWVEDVVATLRIQVELGANTVFLLDEKEWDGRQRAYVRAIIAEAGRRFRRAGNISAADAARRYVLDGEPFFLRGQEQIDGAVVADLADAIERLILDQLPPVPAPGRHWFFGVEDGPRTL